MKRSKVQVSESVQGRFPRQTWERSVRRTYASFVCLGVLGTFLPEGRCVAQDADSLVTVRPREMTIATQNPAAGDYPLDSVPAELDPHPEVSIPPQCVGARRCPLLVFLGSGMGPIEELRLAADKHGLMLYHSDEWRGSIVDAALKEILRRFAVDPNKIAIIGRCAWGGAAMKIGIANLGVFSRVGSISGETPLVGLDPHNKTIEFFIDAGWSEPRTNFEVTQALRQAGHPVKHMIGFRDHEHQVEDYDFLGRWLQASWATPEPATRPAPRVIADPLPVLTVEGLAQMTRFWTSFQAAPESIRTTARRAHLQEVIVSVGEDRPAVVMTDMPALAAQYPSVAAALVKAGLTAEQHDAYRVALLSVVTTNVMVTEKGFKGTAETVAAGSVLATNIAFYRVHPDEFKALNDTGMWHTP